MRNSGTRGSACALLVLGSGLIAGLAWTSTASADVITDWNDAYLDTVRQGTSSQYNNPAGLSKVGAMMHAAMFNAVNGVDQTHRFYGGFNTTDSGASREAAAAQAAYDVMRTMYPAAQFPALNTMYSNRLNSQLSAIPNGAAKTAGIALGSSAATHMISLRAGDGFSNATYTPAVGPGAYVSPNPGATNAAVGPTHGNITPWGMANGGQFRPTRLANYGSLANFVASPEYAANYADVKLNGDINRWTPADDEYKTAFFWANDRNGTYKPPGHLNKITQEIVQQRGGLTLSQNARLYALLNLAMGDAGVAAWDCKYNTPQDLWRPITGIRGTDGNGNALPDDNNPLTTNDPTWQPLNNIDPDGPGPLLADPFTPPFPAYVSGHATFGAAHAAIMREFFGTDSMNYTITTDDPFMPAGYTRSFTSFSQAALENGRSRIYLGVHWQIDAEDGYLVGNNVGNWIYDNYLQPVPAPTGAMIAALGLAPLARRRRHG